MDSRLLRSLLALILLVSLAACQTNPQHKLHHRVLDGEETLVTQDQRLVVLPLSVAVKEMSAAGIQDEVGDWTRQAKDHINTALVSHPPSGTRLEFLALPELSEEEQATVDEHIALFDMVAGGALMYTMRQPVSEAWQPKAEHFDYTVGPGLAFLKEKTGADKALILFGEDVISSSGRKATFVIFAALGVAIPMGHSLMVGGLVDLNTGDILWLNYTVTGGGETFLNREHVDTLLGRLFEKYPGIEDYRKTAQAEQ